MTPQELKSVLIVPYDQDKYHLSVLTLDGAHHVYKLTTPRACRLMTGLMQAIIDTKDAPE